jgi:hypothetical protein
VSLVDANGKPIGCADPARSIETRDALPGWMHSARYRADDDIITITIGVPASSHALAHLLALEMTPDDARSVVDVLTTLIRQSEVVVLDVSPSE